MQRMYVYNHHGKDTRLARALSENRMNYSKAEAQVFSVGVWLIGAQGSGAVGEKMSN